MAGRIQLEIDWNKLDRLLEAGCDLMQACGALGISHDTMHRRLKEKGTDFANYAKDKRSKGDGLLLISQMKKALEGNTQMLIWLGKNRLGQKENTSSENEMNRNLLKQFLEEIKNVSIEQTNSEHPTS